MTEEEGEILHQMGESFWRRFSELVAEHVEMAPEHLKALALVMLQEKSSVYGSNYERVMVENKELRHQGTITGRWHD